MSKSSVVWSQSEYESYLKKNTRAKDTRQTSSVESSSGNGALGKVPVQKKRNGTFLVRVTSVRKRLADEDGLCEKYLVDFARYSGFLPNDDPGTAKIQTTQRKVEKGEEEHTLIEIWEIED